MQKGHTVRFKDTLLIIFGSISQQLTNNKTEKAVSRDKEKVFISGVRIYKFNLRDVSKIPDFKS